MDLDIKLGLRLLSLHQAVYQASDGRVGHDLFGVRCLLIRTTGRRSGRTRTTALAYGRDGDDYLVVGSVGGDDQAPGWLYNLKSRPEIGVQVGRRRFAAVATVVEAGDPDHARLWRVMNEDSGGRYDRYQARTARPIPVVRLTPLR